MTEHPALALVGQSVAIRRLDAEISAAARTDAKVLITGESGVGKEVTAHLIYQRSTRRGHRLCTINCAGIPDSLLESELFGHTRGSFTDAYRDKAGLLELAHGGTVFLDEVGEMSLRMQALLLRFLETGEIQRIGADTRGTYANVRVICATNRNLLARVAAGEFREDLYYRLNVIHIEVPPLRERRDDIGELTMHFLRQVARRDGTPVRTLTDEALHCLTAYDWPGNIRELRNVAERLAARAPGQPVRAADLPTEIRLSGKSCPSGTDAASSRAGDLLLAALYDRLVHQNASFWDTVYTPFMKHDLTRATVRELLRLGLDRTDGDYRRLATLFGIPQSEYRRFIGFLRKHECMVSSSAPTGAGASTTDRYETATAPPVS